MICVIDMNMDMNIVLLLGFNCETCVDGYYGDATKGTAFDCIPCSCYSPRVSNSTCDLVNGTIKCRYCNEGYTGDLCDQ